MAKTKKKPKKEKQILLRVSEELHEAVKTAAFDNRRSMNSELKLTMETKYL